MEKIINGLQGGFYVIAVIAICFSVWTLYKKHKNNKK